MLKYVIATKADRELLMESRLEMLRLVNKLPDNYIFSDELLENSIKYFECGNQTTVLAIDEGVFGCH